VGNTGLKGKKGRASGNEKAIKISPEKGVQARQTKFLDKLKKPRPMARQEKNHHQESIITTEVTSCSPVQNVSTSRETPTPGTGSGTQKEEDGRVERTSTSTPAGPVCLRTGLRGRGRAQTIEWGKIDTRKTERLLARTCSTSTLVREGQRPYKSRGRGNT